MIDQETIDECRAIMARRREDRRRFLRTSAGAVVAAGGLSLLAACDDDDDVPAPTPAPSPTAPGTANDVAILNFALNLEYLEGNYYSFGAFGSGVNASLQTGTGQQGAVTGGRAVTFTDTGVAAYIREIAADENAHIQFLRRTLGTFAVAQPAINIAGDAGGAFTAAARAAGVVGANETFDPYASQDNFLLGAMLLTDVGVTAYKGAAQFIDSKVFLEASAGILAVEAYHSGLLRTLLYRRGLDTASIFTKVQQISDARDLLDGTDDLDQGLTPDQGRTDSEASNIVPTDQNGIVFGRTTGQVLNIAYLNRASATQGGFFPAGVNGTIRASAA
jgi:hypothetical protein